MVSAKSVHKQLKNIRFNANAWGRSEVSELPNILMPDEKVLECVNGMYEGGFALLCSTDVRILLIDKKPLNYLTVEDLRFDMINQIDYSHRLFGARINISAGNKILKFTSYNQTRLRKLIGHVQHRMAELKKEQSSSAETQQQHLERINQQLQAYLLAQHQHQEELRRQLESAKKEGTPVTEAPQAEAIRPSPELADFLFAQSLMQQYQSMPKTEASAVAAPVIETTFAAPPLPTQTVQAAPAVETSPEQDLVEAGRQEIFGKKTEEAAAPDTTNLLYAPLNYLGIEINPLRIAYAKLPMALRNRKFGRPSFHAHSRMASPAPVTPQIAPAQ